MQLFLFLYPIRAYTEHAHHLADHRLPNLDDALRHLNRIIEQRYRQSGFQVAWLLFSKNDGDTQPDREAIHPVYDIRSTDLVLASQVSFATHTGRLVYPSSLSVIDQLPVGITTLRLGGYHQGDCVDRLARCAYDLGIDTMIDEDTTELFWPRHALDGPIPWVRDRFRLSDIGRDENNPRDAIIIEIMREHREYCPWLPQL